jgi:hypothetical protein
MFISSSLSTVDPFCMRVFTLVQLTVQFPVDKLSSQNARIKKDTVSKPRLRHGVFFKLTFSDLTIACQFNEFPKKRN